MIVMHEFNCEHLNVNFVFPDLVGEKVVFRDLDEEKVAVTLPWLEMTNKFTRHVEVKYKENSSRTLTTVHFPYDPEVTAYSAHPKLRYIVEAGVFYFTVGSVTR